MNLHQKGYYQGKAILQTIEKQNCLNTDQIRTLFYMNKKSGQRMAQRKMQKLYENGKVKRGKEDFTQPYYYYIDKRPKQLEHLIGVNWIYIWTYKQLKSWEEMQSFDRETDYGILRSDAFISIKNTVTNKYKFIFAEMDIASSENRFNKIDQHTQLYSEDKYLSAWWASLATGYPKVLIVTTAKGRLNTIQKQIETKNICGLEFEVVLLDDIRRDCLC